MCKVTITSKNTQTSLDFTPSADFLNCAMGAVLAALPVFLQSLMSCLTGGASSDKYEPGDRLRCH